MMNDMNAKTSTKIRSSKPEGGGQATVGTHTGQRVRNRGTCEKCATPTNWVIGVSGRLAYWCGCGN
jgi:hypothetical protein